MRVTVHIAHAAFLEERRPTLERLLSQLAPQCKPIVHRSEQREHASVWAVRVYRAVAAENAEAALVLNDDVEVSPDIVGACEAMMAWPTSRMVSLHTVHPMARSLAEAGQRWFSTYHLTGPAYIFRRGVAKQMLDYYADTPKAWNTKLHEDNVAIQYAYRHREPIWNSLPGLVKHDTSVSSTLGFENHPQRTCIVPWDDNELFANIKPGDMRKPEFWKPEGDVPFMPTHWTPDETLKSQEICNDLGIGPDMCWWCASVPAVFGSPKTGARMCHQCLMTTVGGVINAALKANSAGLTR